MSIRIVGLVKKLWTTSALLIWEVVSPQLAARGLRRRAWKLLIGKAPKEVTEAVDERAIL